jgi:hypothetical protein
MAIAKRCCVRSLTFSLLAINFFAICEAGLIIDLSTSDNLTDIAIGQSVTLNVNLSGVLLGDELNFLGATVTYDSSRFGLPTINAGSIVPNPLNDPLDFGTAPAAGIADAYFLTFGTNAAEHITSNGVFFSFSATALSSGPGSFSLQFVDAGTFDPTDPFTPITQLVDSGANLNYQVNSASVPEPNSATLLCMSVIGILSRTWYRRRKGRAVVG